MKSPYETLGVAPGASPDEVRIAFRRAASAAHPDRHGGDGDRMSQVNEAYAVLGDPERRRRFDETGSTREQQSIETEAMQALADILKGALEQDERGVIEFARASTAKTRGQIVNTRASALAKKERLAKKRNRVRVKGEAANMVHAIIDAQVSGLAKQVQALDRALLVADGVAKLLDAYEEDPMAPQWRPAFSAFPTGTWGA